MPALQGRRCRLTYNASVGEMPDREHELRLALGIVCALERERPRRMAGAVVAVGGPGRENAARAAEKLATENEPSGLVSFGFAGALAPRLKIGDVVVDTCVPKWRAVAQARNGWRVASGEGQEDPELASPLTCDLRARPQSGLARKSQVARRRPCSAERTQAFS